MWLHTLIKRGLAKAESAPGKLVWSASALVWAYSTKSIHSYRCGYNHGVNVSDWFLARYPDVQREYREFIRGGGAP